MKVLVTLLSVIALSFSAYAKKPASTSAAATETSKIQLAAVAPTQVLQPSAHISTSINGLVTGNFNVNANLFVSEAAAFSLGYSGASEREEPINKKSFPAKYEHAVETTQVSLGGAYYLMPHDLNKNVVLNPFLMFERRSDVRDVESNTGLGLRADAIYKLNHLAINAGLQSVMMTGQSATGVIVGAGYIF
jgi:hypothetical protein